MSKGNVEIVRRVYDAAARRDSRTILSLYDPNEKVGFRYDGQLQKDGEVVWRFSLTRRTSTE